MHFTGANTSGTWEHTFEFKDGIWEALRPAGSDADCHVWDMHGMWHISLVRMLPPPPRMFNVEPSPRHEIPRFDMSSTSSVCADAVNEELVTIPSNEAILEESP